MYAGLGFRRGLSGPYCSTWWGWNECYCRNAEQPATSCEPHRPGKPPANSYTVSSNTNRAFVLNYLVSDQEPLEKDFELEIKLGVRVKGSFIPTVCKELASLACWSKVSDLSLSDCTDQIMQCLLRTAPLCLLFLLVCPLGSQHSLQCLCLANQHAHLSERSAGNSGELQQCWQDFFFF